jgi:hypothetical protein
MEKSRLQNEICKAITNIGGRIKWKKELGLPARFYYFVANKEPVINIEALFLGERFAVIIGEHRSRRMFDSSGYRIIVCNSIEDFTQQFNEFKYQKLNDD